jgi:hypothetical protein
MRRLPADVDRIITRSCSPDEGVVTGSTIESVITAQRIECVVEVTSVNSIICTLGIDRVVASLKAIVSRIGRRYIGYSLAVNLLSGITTAIRKLEVLYLIICTVKPP